MSGNRAAEIPGNVQAALPERRRRRNESGYALLLVFLMSALIAISLYMEIPRVAFQSQRQKEQLLMFRGEQYKRAIKVFMRTNQRWPAKIEDLESTNGKRFLRQRYIDPMTGKDEWRVIHVQNGVLTDSKIKSKDQQQQQDNTTAIGQTVGQVASLGLIGAQGPNGAAGVNLATRRRESDNHPVAPGMASANPGGTNPPGVSGPGLGGPIPGMPTPGTTATGQPGIPGQIPGMPPGVILPGQGMQPGQAGLTGVVQPGMAPGSTPTVPGGMGGSANTGANSGSGYLGGGGSYLGSGSGYLGGSSTSTPPSGTRPPTGMQGQPGYPPGMPVSQMGGLSPTPGSPFGTPGAGMGATTGFGQTGTTAGFGQTGTAMNPQAQSAAAQLIGNILTQPRPGGMPMAGTAGMAAMGSGIAGFASTADQDSIMVYNDQTNYGLWEFVYDPTKDKPLPNPNGGTPGTPGSQIGNQIGTPATQVGTPAGSMGTTPGTGFGGGFGTPGTPPIPRGPGQ